MPDESAPSGSSRQPCRRFMYGTCPDGERCRYPHISRDPPETLPSNPSGPGRRGRNRRGRGAAPSGTQAVTLNEPLPTPQSVTPETLQEIDHAGEAEQRVRAMIDQVRTSASPRPAVGPQQPTRQRVPEVPSRGEAGRRGTKEDARKAARERAAAVARIQAEECAREEREAAERTALEQRNAQAAREQAKERERFEKQRAQEEAVHKERVEREEAERWANEALEEVERKRREEREEAERKAREEQEEVERKAREAQEEAERIAREEREEAERKARAEREEAERKAREAELEERRAQEARQQALERAVIEEQRAREEAARREMIEREEAERRAKAVREEAERRERARKEAERKERMEREAAVRRAKAAREEAARQAKAAREEAARQAKAAREEAERKAREKRLKERQAQEARVIVRQMVLGSALVTCGAGIDIRSIITGFDLHRVIVKDVPRNANLDEVATLLTQQDANPENVFLEDTKPNGRHLDATFLVKAEMFASGSDRTIDFQGQRLRFEVGPAVSGDTMALSSQNPNTLTVYWRVPSTSMIATYATLEIAKAKAKELDGKMFNGRRVKAFMNTPPPTQNWRQHNPASIKLMNLPLNVPITEVEVFSGALSLRVLQSPVYIPEEFLDFLCKHLEGLPGVIRGTFVRLPGRTPNPTSRIEIKFRTWEEAKFVCDTLNNHRLRDDYPYIHTLLPRAHQYIANIPREQYQSQKRQWNSLVKEKENGMARVHVSERNNGRVVITVEGNDKKAVGALKVRVESLVTGERLDPSYWDRSFFLDAGFDVLRQVHDESGAYVRIDKKVQTLRVYGDTEAVDEAKEMIEAVLSSHSDQVTMLKQRSVQHFVRRGLASLKEILGEDNVSLDLTSIPCKVTIRGGDEARHHLARVMDESLADHSLDQGHTDICPICYDTASHPESLGCGHSYCTACLSHYLESAANTKKFPLVCMGNNTTCGTPISIPLIKRFLTLQRFNQLVEAAFLSYLDQHPRELKYCTTPDCSQIYRRDLTRPFLQCPACFSSICPSCQEESHEGTTCLQWRRYNPTAGQEWFTDDWASSHGIKKCPGCGIWIEKTEGCNHLTCRCGDHVCWKCMGIFTAETIYAHMHNVHGEIHDEPPQRALEEQRKAQLLAAQVAAREQQERERQRQAAELEQMQRLRALQQAQAVEAENRRRLYAEAHRQREETRLRLLRVQEEERQREERMREARVAREREAQAAREREARAAREREAQAARERDARAAMEREARRQQWERHRRAQEEAGRESTDGSGWGLAVAGALLSIGVFAARGLFGRN